MIFLTFIWSGIITSQFYNLLLITDHCRRDGVALKTLKNGIHSYPAWRSAQWGKCGEQAGDLEYRAVNLGDLNVLRLFLKRDRVNK